MNDAPQSEVWVRLSGRLGALLVCALLMVMGAAFLIAALRLETGTLQQPGPGLYPLIVAAGLVILTALHAFSSHKQDRSAEISLGHRNSTAAALMLAFIALIFQPLGFAISSVTLIAGLTWLFTTAGVLRALLYGAAATSTFHLVFVHLLKASLPGGVLPLP